MSDTESQKQFKELFERTKKLRTRYMHTLASFRIFEGFKKLSAPNIVGKKKAHANVKVFNDYKYFFLTTHEASRCYFFIELAKFFDNDKRGQSLTIKTTLKYAHKNIKSFSTKEFQIYHKERSIFPELFKTYKPLILSDIKKIERRLIRNEKIIKDLKTYRDEYLAHDDLEKTEVHIKAREIKILFKIIRDTIELLYHKLEFGSNAYDNYDKEPVADINRVVKDLQEHEKERIRKIKEKYNY